MEKYFNRADTAQIGTIGPGNRDGYRGAPKTVASAALAIGSNSNSRGHKRTVCTSHKRVILALGEKCKLIRGNGAWLSSFS